MRFLCPPGAQSWYSLQSFRCDSPSTLLTDLHALLARLPRILFAFLSRTGFLATLLCKLCCAPYGTSTAIFLTQPSKQTLPVTSSKCAWSRLQASTTAFGRYWTGIERVWNGYSMHSSRFCLNIAFAVSSSTRTTEAFTSPAVAAVARVRIGGRV